MSRLPVLAVLCAGVCFGHGVHTSVTLLNFNPQSKSLEISLMLNATDLETVLRRQTQREIEIDRSPGVETLTYNYFLSVLQVQTAQEKPLKPKWIGMKISADMVYAYLELPLGEMPESLRLRNDLFFDLLPDQTNLVSLQVDHRGKSSDHLFRPGGSFQTATLTK